MMFFAVVNLVVNLMEALNLIDASQDTQPSTTEEAP